VASKLSNIPTSKGLEDDLYNAIFGDSDWEEQVKKLETLVSVSVPNFFNAGKNEAETTLQMGIDLDLLNPKIRTVLDKYTASEVTQIDETTRSTIKRIIDQAVENGKGVPETAREINDQFTMFGKVRSKLIAHNEIAQVYSQAEMMSYRESGVVKGKKWWTANDDKVSQGCYDNQQQGVIPLGKSFQSGHDAPPRHPRCRCVVIPEVA